MRRFTQFGVVLVATVLVLGSVPGLVAAQSGQVGGAVVIEAGDVHQGDLQVVGGSVVVHGTVDGDVQAVAGDVTVTGTVTGNIDAAAGSITILGDVGGNINSGAGSVTIGDGAHVGGDVNVGAATVTIAGTIDGTLQAGGDSIVLAPTAVVNGDVVYDGVFVQQPGATVAGTIREDAGMGAWRVGPIGYIPDYAATITGIIVTLVFGAIILTLIPDLSSEVATRVQGDTVHSGLVGLLAIVGGVIGIVLVAITLVGIPIAILLAVALGLAGWIGSILGQYAVGDYALGRTGRDDRWLALVVGVVGIALVELVPILGGLVAVIVSLLGFGALVATLYDRYQGRKDAETEQTTLGDSV